MKPNQSPVCIECKKEHPPFNMMTNGKCWFCENPRDYTVILKK